MKHLFELPGSGWRLWRSICVRGAGFPAQLIEELTSKPAAAAIRDLLDLEANIRRVSEVAIASLESDLASTPSEHRRSITSVIKQLRAGRAVAPLADVRSPVSLSPASIELLNVLGRAHAQLANARGVATELADSARKRQSEALRNYARNELYREALVWQNRRALHDGVDVLLRQPEHATSSKTRQHERLIANHIQRYALKNESIGFFGPVGWGTIDDAQPSFSMEAGPALLRRRFVHLEYWGYETLAKVLATDDIRPRLAPRLGATSSLEGTTLRYPIDREIELPPGFVAVLSLIDGKCSAEAIARRLVSEEVFDEELEVYELLEGLVRQRIIIWTIEIAPYADDPAADLRHVLQTIDHAEGLAKLDLLDRALARVASAAGDVTALDCAMTELDRTFTQITGSDATRRPGQAYAGRTLLYEDCERDVDVRIGPAVLETLAEPLSLVLASIRWYTFELAKRHRTIMRELYLELAGDAPSLAFMKFWDRASDVLGKPTSDLLLEFQQIWMKLLKLEDLSVRRVELTSASIATAVEAQFAAPGPGWPSARQHSPDLMIAAPSADAIRSGEYTFVAGEFHVACSTIATRWTARLHPDPASIVAAMQADLPTPVVDPVAPSDNVNRASRFSIRPNDYDLELGSTLSRRPRSQVLEAGSLRVVPTPTSLQIVTRDGVVALALEEFLDSFLTSECLTFRLFPSAPHMPRITIGNFIVNRESWSFDPSTLEFATVADPIDRMLAIDRWASQHQLPRFMFYKIPEEQKPCFVDLESPHFVDLMAHLVRKSSRISFSEMLPAPDDLWLADRNGARYASELRIVAVDPRQWSLP